MSSPQPKSLTRRIVKLASLGLFGLLAGLLAGCTSSPKTYNTASYTHMPVAPKSLESTRTPEIKHAPAPHHVQPWPSRYGPMPSAVGDIQSGHTATESTFTASAASPQLHGQ